tara:strand:- start:338762 stop:339496 length:735 start_codon:yes stop_codon:yes gene_type:complete
MNSALDVVILAAGIGSRLRPLTDKTPKCMIEVGGVTIIERILNQLDPLSEVDSISILTGHEHKKIAYYIAESYPKVDCIYNKDYLNTNNMYSLYLFLKQRKNDKDLVILNADCIYDTRVVEKCIQYSESCIMTDSSIFLKESMKVKVDGEQAKGISKEFNQGKDVYTSIDLYKFKKETASLLTEIVYNYINNDDYNQWTEVAINDLLIRADQKIYTNDIDGHKWFEIDTVEDLKKARKLFSEDD